MISAENLARSVVLATIILLGPLSVIVGAQPQSSASQKNKAVILWVREVHGQVLNWVEHKPADRAPLSAIVAATHSTPHYTLIVILDSRVPIQEVAQIQALVQKLDAKDVRCYVYDAAHARLGMSELVWKTETLPLPEPPPPPSVPK